MGETGIFMGMKNKFPILVEKDKDGAYVVECPLFKGCYTQGKSLDEALAGIKEVIGICLEEKENKEILKSYNPSEVGLYTVSI